MKKAVDDLFDIYKKDVDRVLRYREINSYIGTKFDNFNNFRTKFNEYYTSNRIGKIINKINPFTTTKEKFDMIDEFMKNKEKENVGCLKEHAKYEEVNKNMLDKNTEYFINEEDCIYESIGKFNGTNKELIPVHEYGTSDTDIITQFIFGTENDGKTRTLRTEKVYKLKSAIGGRRRKQTKKSKKSKRTRVLMKSRRRK